MFENASPLLVFTKHLRIIIGALLQMLLELYNLAFLAKAPLLYGTTTLSIMTLSIMALSITTFSIMTLFATLGMIDTQHKSTLKLC
jgi:hypothetical protein